jgi:hypothetical protein
MEIRPARRGAICLGAVVSSTALFGCFGTPRAQDALTPREFYQQATEREAPCDRPIKVLPAGVLPGRPHREIATISATCAPGALELCERRLKERACALGADVLVLTEGESGPNPAATPLHSFVSRDARALRWDPP